MQKTDFYVEWDRREKEAIKRERERVAKLLAGRMLLECSIDREFCVLELCSIDYAEKYLGVDLERKYPNSVTLLHDNYVRLRGYVKKVGYYLGFFDSERPEELICEVAAPIDVFNAEGSELVTLEGQLYKASCGIIFIEPVYEEKNSKIRKP